jgi:uncharacterized protein
MELSSFTIFLTQKCNFNCSYCFQKRGNQNLGISTIKRALDFFTPFFADDYFLNFYGGEPLIGFDKIKETVRHLQAKNRTAKKKIHFTMTTNGSLLDEPILQFLSRNNFSLLLSFDGLAQELSRKEGSFGPSVSLIEKILETPGIELETNSVFTPETIRYLSRSLQFITELGVPEIDFALSRTSSWNKSSILRFKKELRILGIYMRAHYHKKGTFPLTKFRDHSGNGLFYCSAGRDRMTLAPDGKLWGCHLFADYFKGKEGTPEYQKYCFGDLDSFIKDYKVLYPDILSNHFRLRMSYFETPDGYCLQCGELGQCSACPLEAAFSGLRIGRMPSWICEVGKIFRREKRRFLLQ